MIEFNSVSKGYGSSPVLTEVSFHIEPGEFVFLTGKSGAGKTTIMRLLTGQSTADAGTISFDGQDLSTLRHRDFLEIRRKVGVIYQDYKLLPERTVAENIALGLEIMGRPKEEVESRVKDLLTLINLTDKADVFPSQLSGGEAQRVCIARALATAPRVIFADEPTGNLDEETGMMIAQLLMKLNELGTTIIMATHNMRIVESFDTRHIHLENSKVAKDHRPSSHSSKNKKTKK